MLGHKVSQRSCPHSREWTDAHRPQEVGSLGTILEAACLELWKSHLICVCRLTFMHRGSCHTFLSPPSTCAERCGEERTHSDDGFTLYSCTHDQLLGAAWVSHLELIFSGHVYQEGNGKYLLSILVNNCWRNEYICEVVILINSTWTVL